MPRSFHRSSVRLAAPVSGPVLGLVALMGAAASPLLAQTQDTAPAATQTEETVTETVTETTENPATGETETTTTETTTEMAAPEAEAQPAPPQPKVMSTHGDWDVVCLDGKAPCIMRQAGFTENGQEVMEVSLRRISPQQTQQGTVEAVLDVRVPLGILLREGLTMQVDSAEEQRLPYTICVQDGCLMREPLPNAVLSSLKRGATAKMAFAAPQGNQAATLAANISLTGFTAAYQALKP